VDRPLTVSGALTLRDPRGKEYRLAALGSSLVLEVQGLRSLRELGRLAPGGRARAHVGSWLNRGLEEAHFTLYVSLWGRTIARLSPEIRERLLGRLTGLLGLRLTPKAFLLRRSPAVAR
jgi:hypothetical protein